jgi:DNA-binding CsgD family transcriptional regulator
LRDGRRIKVEPMDWMVEENGYIRAQISQLPLRLAWAITVHKSQGMNLDEAIMDLSGVFEFGQGYVALSRVRRLSGLYLLGWNARTFQVHPEILAKDENFRQASSDAEMAFSEVTPANLQKRQNNFIVACDGKLKPVSVENREHSVRQEKTDTYNKTLQLWNKGLTLFQIAEARGFTEGTILNHIEKLATAGKINQTELLRLTTPSLNHSLSEIHDAFRELDTDKLSPVFEKFNGLYSYNELRLARLLLDDKSIKS